MNSDGIVHIDAGNLESHHGTKTGRATYYSVFHFIVDLTFFFLIVVAGIIVEAAPLPVRELGFFCDDRNIRFPYTPSTIPTVGLIFFALVPLAFFIGLTLLEHFVPLHKYGHLRIQTHMPATPFHVKLHCVCREIKIPYGVWKTMLTMYAFFIGIFITLIVTGTVKLAVGELRPYFLDVCQPDFTKIACKDAFGNPNYVTNFTCNGEDTDRIREARLSFPSGHASFIVYNMVYLMFFFELKPYIPRGLRSGVTLLFALTGVLVAITRFFDYHHHPQDLIGGTIIGLMTAIFTYFYHLRLNTVARELEDNPKVEDGTAVKSFPSDINSPARLVVSTEKGAESGGNKEFKNTDV